VKEISTLLRSAAQLRLYISTFNDAGSFVKVTREAFFHGSFEGTFRVFYLTESGICQGSDTCGTRIEHGTARIGIRNTKRRAACKL
jgi:hypothetical protein